MKLPNIDHAVSQGMDLLVTKSARGEFHARVWMGTLHSSHDAKGRSVSAALQALEQLLTQKGLTPGSKR